MSRLPNLTVSFLSLVSVLVVWTQPALLAGNRIKFGSEEYTFTEGQSSKCLNVVKVGSPATSNFPVTYTIDVVLLGGGSGVRTGSLDFTAGNSSAMICLETSDDEIVCERDVVGIIRLINTSILQVDEPSTATVRIKDDDNITVNFLTESKKYTEGSGMQDIAVSLVTSVRRPITIQVTGAATGDIQEVSSNSGVPLSFMLTYEPTIQSKIISLDITDDNIALEDPEEIVLLLSSKCNIEPSIGQMQVTILDNDEVVIELKEEHVSVMENERAVQVCVLISSEIARPLAFSITTQDQSATGGTDYTNGVFTGEFAPFSQVRELCLSIPIMQDVLVEVSETFSVSLAIDSIPESQSEHLRVTNTMTQVSIQDSSYCFAIKLTPLDVNKPQFTPPRTTICFMCKCEAETPVSWTVQGRPVGAEHGMVLSNGTLLIPDSSQEFSSDVSTVISCMVQENYSFEIFLGEPASVLNLIYAQEPTSGGLHLILTCNFEGLPAPAVQWSFGGVDLELPNPYMDIETSSVQSVLTVFNVTESDLGTYACNVENVFGDSNDVITVTVDKPSSTGAGVGSGDRRIRSCADTLTVLFLLYKFILY